MRILRPRSFEKVERLAGLIQDTSIRAMEIRKPTFSIRVVRLPDPKPALPARKLK